MYNCQITHMEQKQPSKDILALLYIFFPKHQYTFPMERVAYARGMDPFSSHNYTGVPMGRPRKLSP